MKGKKTNYCFLILFVGCISFALIGCVSNSASSDKKVEDSEDVYGSSSSVNESSVPGYVTYDENDKEAVETGYNYFGISDRYDMNGDISLEEFYNQDNCIEKLYSFHELLSENLEYLEFYQQPVQKIGYYDGTISFVEDENKDYLNQIVTSDNGKEEYVTTFKTIEIGKTLNKQLNDVITSGRCFNDDDFNYKNNHRIPVILGSEYQKQYMVGDKLSLYYIADTFEFEIAGFFPEDYTIKSNSAIYNLNNFICIPFFEVTDISSCDLNKDFLFSFYLQKNNCYIAYNAEKREDKKAQEELTCDIVKRVEICYGVDECVYSQFKFSY